MDTRKPEKGWYSGSYKNGGSYYNMEVWLSWSKAVVLKTIKR